MAGHKIDQVSDLGKPFSVTQAGQVLWAGGAAIRCNRIDPYTRLSDAAPSLLAEMAGECAECGAPFVFRMAASGAAFYPVRRCALHRQAGKKAAPHKARP